MRDSKPDRVVRDWLGGALHKVLYMRILATSFLPQIAQPHVLLLVLITLQSESSIGQQWKLQLGGGGQSDQLFMDIQFLNSNVGFAAGRWRLPDGLPQRVLVRTTDGGISWRVFAYMHRSVTALSFIDSLEGLILTLPEGEYRGEIIRTSDGGRSWTTVLPMSDVWLYDLLMASPSSGIAVGTEGTVFATNDGGRTWTRRSSGSSADLSSIALSDDSTFWVAGISWRGGVVRTVLRSSDWGESWTRVYSDSISSSSISFIDLGFFHPMRGIVICQEWNSPYRTKILQTNDGGQSWEEQWMDTWFPRALFRIDSATVVITGSMGCYKTTDAGNTWNALSTQGGMKTFFIDRYRGWMASSGVYRTTNGSSSWIRYDDSFNYPSFTGISTWGPNRATVVGLQGSIMHTTNRGTDWVEQSSGTRNSLYAIRFTDSSRGIAVGAAGTILRTTNSGLLWESRTIGSQYALRSLVFIDSEHAIAVGDSGTTLRSTNGGLSWSKFPSPTMASLRSVCRVSGDTAVAVGTEGVILRTEDGGRNWSVVRSGMGNTLRGVSFADMKFGIAVGNQTNPSLYILLVTTNGGRSWVQSYINLPVSYSFPRDLHGVAWADSSTVFIASDDGVLYRYVRGTGVWSVQTTLPSVTLRGVAFLDRYRGFTIGDGGTVFHTTSGGETPPTVFLLGPTGGNFPRSVNLFWRGSPEVPTYHLQVSKSSGFGSHIIFEDTLVTDTFKSVYLPRYGRIYYWRVRSRIGDLYGPWSLAWQLSTAPYASVEIREIQSVISDSLKLLDSLQQSPASRWTLQASAFSGKPITTTGICIVPPNILSAAGDLVNLVIADTTLSAEEGWGTLYVRFRNDIPTGNVSNIRVGDYLRIRGEVMEIPVGRPQSMTVLIADTVMFLGSRGLPRTILREVSDFRTGPLIGGRVNYSVGELYEGTVLEFRDLTVCSHLDAESGRFVMRDRDGNEIATDDASRWFTLRAHRDPASSYALPPLGSHIQSIRGVIVSGATDGGGGYMIAAIYPTDLVLGPPQPGIIRGVLFADENRNRIMDVAESLLSNWPVGIRSESQPFERILYSRSDGSFRFSDLERGAYVIENAARPGWMNTDPNSSSRVIEISEPLSDHSVSFGLYYHGNVVKGLVYEDRDENGVWSSGDLPLRDWAVRIRGPGGIDKLGYTNNSGQYFVDRLPAGDYQVAVILRPGWSKRTATPFFTEDRVESLMVRTVRFGNAPEVVTTADFGVYRTIARVRIPISFYSSAEPAIQRTVYFGVRPGATFGLWGISPTSTRVDSMEGEFDLPYQAPNLFDVRFVDPRGGTGHFYHGGWTDIRNYASPMQVDTFRLSCQPWFDEYPAVLRWSKEQVRNSYEGSVIMRGLGAGASASVDMKLTDSLVIPSANYHDFRIVAVRPLLSGQLSRGWHMMSLPLAVPDGRKQIVLGDGTIPVFGYSRMSGYRFIDTLRPGEGYFVLLSNGIDSLLPFYRVGQFRGIDTIPLHIGWNLVGSLSGSMNAASVHTEPAGILASRFFSLMGGYAMSDLLEPGRGYWVKARAPGKLILSLTNSGGQFSKVIPTVADVDSSRALLRLIVEDARGQSQRLYYGLSRSVERNAELEQYYALPPVPPDGVFDVRYSHQSLLASVRSAESREYRIELRGVEYPLRVRWDGGGEKSLPDTSMVEDVSAWLRVEGGAEVALESVRGEVIVSGSLEEDPTLVLRLDGTLGRRQKDIPGDFSLEQNYPNPFNPVTVIRYSLPVASRVTLRVYNTLGQEVVTLVDGIQEAGYLQGVWRATGSAGTPIATGLYFYRLDAVSIDDLTRSFTRVRKMLLVR